MLKYKKCPACSYKNHPENDKCNICRQNITKEKIIIEKKRKYNFLFLVAIFVIVSVTFYLRHFQIDKEYKGPFLLVEEKGYLNLPGIKASLLGLAKLKIPDESEEKIVFENLENSDLETKMLALKTLVEWYCKASRKDIYIEKIFLFLKKNSVDNRVKVAIQELKKTNLKNDCFLKALSINNGSKIYEKQ